MRRVLLLLLLIATPALAQTPAERAAALNHLLDALQAAPTAEVAAPLEQRIMQLLVGAGSPVVTLLLSRGAREMQAGANPAAIEDFTDAITLDPSLAEAYHQRARARFAAGDTEGAIADIEQTLEHEPRDFAALRTLAAIAEIPTGLEGRLCRLEEIAGNRSDDRGRRGPPEGFAPPGPRRGDLIARPADGDRESVP